MPSVGNLSSSLTMTDNGFSATLNTGASQAQKFGQTVNNNAGHFVNFNAKALESRRAIGTLAATAGTSAGPIMHFIHAFALFGPEVGAAIATLLVLNEVMSANAEAAKNMAESNARAHEVMKKSAELITGHKDTEAQKTIHDIGKEITKQKQEIMEIQKAGNAISFHLNPWGEKRDIAEHEAIIARLKGEYQALKAAAGGFQERHLGSAVHGQQLGVLRLEHTMQSRDNPLLAEAQKQTALLQQMVGKDPGNAKRSNAPGRAAFGGSALGRLIGSFTQQAGL